MNNKKATKRALLTSVMALVMCVVMLVGTTFAWFTDTASTGVNKITSGNLQVQIQDKDGNKIENLNWVAKDNRAQNAILWEPGCRYTLTPFKIVNTGNLALKYKIVITGLDGDADLLKVINFTYTTEDGETFDMTAEGHLTAKGTNGAATELITVTAEMDKLAGNEYKEKTLENVKFTVLATQDMVENDSFNNKYDKDAEYAPKLEDCTVDSFTIVPNGFSVITEEIPEKANVFPAYTKHTITISSADALLYYGTKFDLEAAKKVEGNIFTNNRADAGGDVIELKLGADIDLGGVALSKPLDIYAHSFDGCGYTISNATITNTEAAGVAGLFDVHGVTMTSFKNVTIKNVTVTGGYGGDSMAGVVFGKTSGTDISGVTVENCSVTGGKFTGAVVGYCYASVQNCSVNDTTVNGGYKVGGIAGYVCRDDGEILITGNKLSGVTVKAEPAISGRTAVIGKIVGNWNAPTGTCNNNDFSGTTTATDNIGRIESGRSVTTE